MNKSARPPRKLRHSTVDAGDESLGEVQVTKPRRSPVERAQDEEEAGIIEQLKEQAGEGSYVRLYRREPGDMDFSALGKLPFSTFSEDVVMEMFGGGEYRARVCTSTHKIVRNLPIKISLSIPSKNPFAKPAEAASPGGTNEILQTVLDKMGDRGDDDSPSTMQMMMMMFKMQQQSTDNLFKLMALRGADGGGSVNEKLLMALIGRQQSPVSETFEAFERLQRLMKKGESGEDNEPKTALDRVLDMLAKVAPSVLPMVMAAANGGLPPMAPVQPALTAAAEQLAPAAVNGNHGAPAAKPS